MTREYTYLFHNAVEGLMEGGMTRGSAEDLISRLVAEGSSIISAMDDPEEIPVKLSAREYDLCMKVIRKLSTGGTSEGRAIVLTMSLMAAVEERVNHQKKVCR